MSDVRHSIEPLTVEKLDDYVKPCWVPGEDLAAGAASKKELLREQLDDGFIGRLLYVEERPVGLAEALPLEIAPFKLEGRDTAVLHCIWVKPDWQGRGYGRELLEAVRRAAAPSALAAFGFDFAGFMPADFFLHFGFQQLEERDSIKLLYLRPEGADPEEAPRVSWLPRNYKPALVEGKLVVEVFADHHCPYASLIARRVTSAARELDPLHIEVIIHDVSRRPDTLRLGKSLGVFADGKELFLGPLPRDQIVELLEEQLSLRGWR